MRKSVKILIMIGILIAASIIGAVIMDATGNDNAPIFVVGLAAAAIMAVWKYKPAGKSESQTGEQQAGKK
jgi:hypothetical protein